MAIIEYIGFDKPTTVHAKAAVQSNDKVKPSTRANAFN